MASSSNSKSGATSTNSSRHHRSSYADWITRAIESSTDSKMTLANIYNWMAYNVPGLYEKRNLHSSKGWKNAVRHTLSVNRRFNKSTQPNRRAAYWSLATSPSSPCSTAEVICSSSDQVSELRPPLKSAEGGACSSSSNKSLKLDQNNTRTGGTGNSEEDDHSASASASVSASAHQLVVPSPTTELEQTRASVVVETQTLELYQQDGTVRSVTVPKPYPIHVVGELRLVPMVRVVDNATSTTTPTPSILQLPPPNSTS